MPVECDDRERGNDGVLLEGVAQFMLEGSGPGRVRGGESRRLIGRFLDQMQAPARHDRALFADRVAGWGD